MSKMPTRVTAAGTTLDGATLKTLLLAVIDALNTAGLQEGSRTTITSSGTLAITQCGLVLVDCTAGNVILTLPASGAANDDAAYCFRRLDSSSNTLTVQRGGTDTLEGSATGRTIGPNGILAMQLPAGATNWRVTSIGGGTPFDALANLGIGTYATAGSAPAYTTTTRTLYSLTSKAQLRVQFHAATSGAMTLAVNGGAATSVKQYDANGNKVDPVVVSGQIADLEYDGTHQVILNPLPPAVPSSPPVRQTVLSGPVDSDGLPNFGGSTGSTTVTTSGTLKATAAAGGDANYTGSIVNPSWTGLSSNGTMYLYLDITSAGVVTTGSTTLAPNYQWGGAYSTTNGQNTYNIQEATMKAGNGSTAAQVYRVFVGEVTVSGGVVTAITWYALMGRYTSPEQTIPAANSTTLQVNHNLGVVPLMRRTVIRWKTTVGSRVAGEESPFLINGVTNGNQQMPGEGWCNRLYVGFNSGVGITVQTAANGDYSGVTGDTTDKIVFYASRGW